MQKLLKLCEVCKLCTFATAYQAAWRKQEHTNEKQTKKPFENVGGGGHASEAMETLKDEINNIGSGVWWFLIFLYPIVNKHGHARKKVRGEMAAPPPIDVLTHKLDIRTLYHSQKRRDDSKRELYETIMAKAHHRIKTVAARSETVCTFQIPPYIIGMPLYDSYQCCGYVIRRLKSEGFIVQYAHPNVLMMSWDRHSIEPYVREMEQQERRVIERQRIEQRRTTMPLPAAAIGNNRGGANATYVPTGKLFS